MGRGIEIYGIEGNLQASTDRYTWGQSGNGSCYMTDTGMTHPQPRVRGYIDVTGVNPEIFIYPPTGKAVYLEQFQPISGGFRYWFGAVSSQPVAFQYWVMDVPAVAYKDPAMASMGVQVFDQNLAVTYDAAMDQLDTKLLATVETPPSQAPSTTGSVQYDRWSLVDQVAIPIPAGRKYAVSISGLANIQGMQDTGQYATGSGYPSGMPIRVDDPNGDPNSGGGGGPNQWRRMRLDTLWSGVEIDNGYLTVGNYFVEQFEGWYPIGQEEHLNCYGKGRFIIADVTDLATTGIPTTPNSPVVNVSAAERRIEVNGAAQNTITPQVTLSISGGTAPYTIQWEFVSGTNTVAPYGGTTGTTFATIVTQQQPDTTHQAYWRARVVSATGVVGYSQDVLFTHVAAAYSVDAVPDALGLSPLTLVSNERQASIGDVADLRGFNQTIRGRVEAYNYVGSADAQAVYVYLGPQYDQWGPWEHVGTFDPRGAAPGQLRYCDFDIRPNDHRRIHIVTDTVTNSGRKDSHFDMVVWKLADSFGSEVQISTGKRITLTVDADNNFNVPTYTPAAFTLPTITVNSNENYVQDSSGQVAQQLTGFNQTITLRLAMVSVAGSMNDGYFRLVRHTPSIGWHEAGRIPLVNGGGSISAQFLPGDYVYTDVIGTQTYAGRKDMSFYGQLFNDSTGGTLIAQHQTFLTVDADNNYNNAPVANYKLDYLDWQDFNVVTNENYAISNHNGQNATGITHQVRLRAYLINKSGYISDGYLRAHNWNGGNPQTRGQWRYATDGEGSFTWLVNPNEHIYYSVDAVTASGRQTSSFSVHTYNESDGGGVGTIIDAFNVGVDIDQNNDYNLPTTDVDPTPFTANGMYAYSGSGFAQGISGPYTLTGFNTQTQLRAYFGFNSYNFQQITNNGGGPIMVEDGYLNSGATMYVYVNGQPRAEVSLPNPSGSYSGPMNYGTIIEGIVFNPGDTVTFYLNLTCESSNYQYGVSAHVAGHIHLQRMINGNTGAIEVTSFPYQVTIEKPYQGIIW